jgi:hypothetical protein
MLMLLDPAVAGKKFIPQYRFRLGYGNGLRKNLLGLGFYINDCGANLLQI